MPWMDHSSCSFTPTCSLKSLLIRMPQQQPWGTVQETYSRQKTLPKLPLFCSSVTCCFNIWFPLWTLWTPTCFSFLPKLASTGCSCTAQTAAVHHRVQTSAPSCSRLRGWLQGGGHPCLPYIHSCKHSPGNGIKKFKDGVRVSIALLMVCRIFLGRWESVVHLRGFLDFQKSGSKYGLSHAFSLMIWAQPTAGSEMPVYIRC